MGAFRGDDIVGTALRGYGWYKWDLLREIYVEFEFKKFAYSEAARLAGFDRKTFISLCNDGWLISKKEPKSRTCLWRLSAAAVNILFGKEVSDEIQLELGHKSRSYRCSKRLLLEMELFSKKIQEAIEFFSNPEVNV